MTNGSQSTAGNGRAKKKFALRHITRKVKDLASELEDKTEAPARRQSYRVK